jgi:uncharacterized protein YdeI (BOF family)
MRKLLIGAALLGLIFAPALAQQITNRSINGTSTLDASVGGPGGQTQTTTVAQLRNAQGVTTTALTTGTLASLTTSTASLVSTAASVSLTVNLPAKPFDGEIFEWVNGSAGAFTAGTIAQTDGSTIVNGAAAGTLAAGASVEYRYVLSTNSWYKIR